MSEKSLNDYLEFAKEAAEIGRNVLTQYFGRLRQVEEKPRAGLVSEADKTSEEKIRAYFSKMTPEFDFLGEEEGESGNSRQGRWICDPLDGTTNYVHGLPFFCVSIGLEIDGQVRVGVIDVPYLRQVYWAVEGQGAYLNGERIYVSDRSTLEESLLVTGFSYRKEDDLQQQIRVFGELMGRTRGIRRTGSAALDLCFLAAGSFDGFWERSLKPWDTAAGSLLVREAGGVVTDFSGNAFDLYQPEILASNPGIHKLLLGIV